MEDRNRNEGDRPYSSKVDDLQISDQITIDKVSQEIFTKVFPGDSEKICFKWDELVIDVTGIVLFSRRWIEEDGGRREKGRAFKKGLWCADVTTLGVNHCNSNGLVGLTSPCVSVSLRPRVTNSTSKHLPKTKLMMITHLVCLVLWYISLSLVSSRVFCGLMIR